MNPVKEARLEPVVVPGSEILIVADCPTGDDAQKKVPFVGAYASPMKQVLLQEGIDLQKVTRTYAIRRPAPQGNVTNFVKASGKNVKVAPGAQAHFDDLHRLIAQVKPKLILALGSVALYALYGEASVKKWRGSQLTYTSPDGSFECRLLPTYSPVAINRQFSWTYIFRRDIQRALSEEAWHVPDYNFIIRPDFATVNQCLDRLLALADESPLRLAVDIETRSGHIACCGIAWSNLDAICIPFMKARKPSGYWPPGEEFLIIKKMRQLLLHPNVEAEYQNGSYDLQYFARWWMFLREPAFDTMYAHHVLWAGMEKGLDFLSSLYCRYHQYWKDEGKHFDLEHHNEEQLWEYNCKDCVVTYECGTVLRTEIKKQNMQEQLDFQLQRNLRTTLRMMLRGIRRDPEEHQNLRWILNAAAAERLKTIEYFCDKPLNPKSPKQVADFFYGEMGAELVIHKKTKRPTTDDDALRKIGKRMPVLKVVCDSILDYRSIGVLSSTFLGMQLDIDGRIRCSYNIAGTETFRYSSSENAFGSGGNLQNIPNPKKSKGEGRFKAPNVKRLFIPDDGYEIADFDLDRADLQVVVWEAGEEKLKQLLREGVDLHLANAQVLFNLPYTIDDLRDPTLAERIKKKYNAHRDFAKAFVHGTNYGGSARTMAAATHTTVVEAEAAQRKWFSTYIGIKDWHDRTLRQLMTERQVVNPFGFRRYYFDRIEGLLPEALAWVPQSTVAIIIDKGIINVDENLGHLDCQPLLQVHDSGVFQYPKDNRAACLNAIREQMEIVVPYNDPLIIPVGAQVSDKSWGDCAEYDFNNDSIAA